MSKYLKSLSFMAVAGLVSVVSANAKAANCELPDGQTLTGQYVQSALVWDQKIDGRAGIVLDVKQDGCKLTVKSSTIHSSTTVVKGKLTSSAKLRSGGTFIFDLSGQKPAVLSKEFLQANSVDADSTAMTKSLDVRTTMQPDGSIRMVASYDFAHAGVTLRMATSGNFKAYLGDLYAGDIQGSKYTGSLSLMNYPEQIKTEVLPAKDPEARNLVISYGVNWILEALQKPIVDGLGLHQMSFFRKQ